MKNIAKKKVVREAKESLARGLAAVVRRDLREFVVSAGLAAFAELL